MSSQKPLAVCQRFLLSTAVALLLVQPAAAENLCATQASPINPLATTSGLGGTGAPRENGGIGGTGMLAGKPGIGGTGSREGGVGGTGIVGVITGFASICVNGVEVQFDADTPVSENGQPGSAKQLAVGQIVAVRAQGVGQELSASRIAMIHAAVGPVDTINSAAGEFTVLGQTVRPLDKSALADLKPGNWVRVSGHRLAQDEIAASRVEPIAAQALAQLIGTISGQADNSITVEGTRIRLEARHKYGELVVGREVVISGQWDGRELRAQRIESDPVSDSLDKVDHVVLEGYIHKLDGNQLHLGHSRVTLSPDVRIVGGTSKQLAINQRIQVSGRLAADRSIRVERIEFRRSENSGKQSSSGESEASDDKGSSSGKESSEKTESTERSGSSGSSESSPGSSKTSEGSESSSGSSKSSGSSESTSGSPKSSGESSGSGSSGGASGRSGSSGSSGRSSGK